jgi:predicted transcriptional regulator
VGTTGALTKDNPARVKRDATIIAARLAGQTYAEIAKTVGISKGTISRILTDEETRDVIQTGTRLMVNLTPIVVNNYNKLIKSENEEIQLKATNKVAEIIGIAPSHTPNVLINQVINQVNVTGPKELSVLSDFIHSREPEVIDITPDSISDTLKSEDV